MKAINLFCRRLGTLSLVIGMLSGVALAQQPEDDARYLLYLPSTDSRVDHAGIVQAFGDSGFDVRTLVNVGERVPDYARRIAGEIRSLLDMGVSPDSITVVGAGVGSGSDSVILTSAAAGNRHVNYVVLGGCDMHVKRDNLARLAGRVLGIRDADGPGARSCRPLWIGDPKVTARRDLVLNTGHGEALFDQARVEWTKPMTEWSSGRVDVGDIQVTALEPREAQGVN